MSEQLPAYADAVLEAVEAIPPGRVLAYGDVAELVGRGGPRQVGRVLSLWGGAVPWWRVLRADGTHAEPLRARALERLRAEGTPLRPDGRVDMARARWQPAAEPARAPARGPAGGRGPELSDPSAGIAP
ncbi:MAG: MGMT family protein [Motilibacteraceae bacterium]